MEAVEAGFGEQFLARRSCSRLPNPVVARGRYYERCYSGLNMTSIRTVTGGPDRFLAITVHGPAR
jgi:hypothetical protein